MENCPFIDVFPIKTSMYKGFSMAMLNNQRVIASSCLTCYYRPSTSPSSGPVMALRSRDLSPHIFPVEILTFMEHLVGSTKTGAENAVV